MRIWLPLLLVGCADAGSAPVPSPTPTPEPTAAPAPAPEPQAEPEPEPAGEPGPDGQAALACEDAPAGMGCVPAGNFVRGVDKKSGVCEVREGWNCADYNAWPKATIWMQTYYMDQTEVTFEAYRACVAEGKCPDKRPAYSDFDRPTQPMTGINWYDAVKYCKARGKHLPTEAEWEKAARGTEGALYPWGSERVTCEHAVIKDEKGRSCGVPKKNTPEKGRPLIAKSRPAGVYGLYEMVGNAQEWVADWYANSYEQCGDACLGADPKGPCGGKEPCAGHELRVVKGGSWYWGPDHANGADRRAHYPINKPYHHFGFRCAASAEEARAIRNGG